MGCSFSPGKLDISSRNNRRYTLSVTRSVALLVAALATAAAGTDYFPPPDASGGWRKLSSKDEFRKLARVDPDKLDAAFEYAKETSQHGGLLVVRNGRLIYERYFGRGDREATPELASCGKAFTSIAVGIGIHEKKDLIPNGL